MMEEVSDDTNGESTFEFVGGKSDENGQGESNQAEYSTQPRRPSNQGVSNLQSSLFPVSAPPPVQPSNTPSIASESKVLFFDPTQYSSTNTVLMSPFQPPPQPPVTSTEMPPLNALSLHTQVTDPQQGPADGNVASPVFHSPPPPQQTYVGSTAQCSFPIPIGNEGDPIQIKQGEEGSVWGWIKGTQILNKMKSSVDSVITTLDPGMKEIINSGGDVSIVVATGNETKISAVREAFQQVFGKATVQGIAVQSTSIAPQPVGFSAGLKAAEERIGNLRQQGYIQSNRVILAIENFITELTPENWFDIGCLLLQDYTSNISLQVYTQAIPIPSHFVQQAKDQTPADYPLGWSGHAITIGQLVGASLGVHHSEWHQALTGVSRREILFLAATTIAGLYKAQLRR